jgi:hypothetical protein
MVLRPAASGADTCMLVFQFGVFPFGIASLSTRSISFPVSLSGSTPGERSGQPPPAHAVLDHYAWRYHCRGLFQMPIAA